MIRLDPSRVLHQHTTNVLKKGAFLCVLSALCWLPVSSARASTAYGTLNNFDCVNDTGTEAHGFEIELEDIHSRDITYTYDYNHYGIPKITEDNSDPLHPRVTIRYAASRNPDGTWTAFTAIPSGPITPTDGHQFTNPSVNFGGEHFGAGYYGAPTAVRYFWLIDDGTGNLVHGPPVYVSTPTFTYYPPIAQQPAQVEAAIVPPPPPAPPVLQFGEATWVNDIKTTTHNPNKVELTDLVDPDPDDPTAHNWANGEPTEVESEFRILQTEFANANNPKGELVGIPEDLPDGDEIITRRYEFYKYIGPIDAESGEAMADAVAPDGLHGVGTVTYNDYFDPMTGEWVEVTVDLSTIVVVGEFFGAQMAGFDVAPALGLIDHIPDGELGVPYAERTVVVAGGAAFLASVTGALPDGTTLDELTGIFSGTPTVAGVFTFTVNASDTSGAALSKTYIVTVPEAVSALHSITTSASPLAGGTTAGDGDYMVGTPVTVVATHNPGYAFVNWTEGGIEVSASEVYPFTVNADRVLVANFTFVGCVVDADCTDMDACTADTCVNSVCQHAPVAGCCAADVECDDADVCTTDLCVNQLCQNTGIAGCCAGDGDCDDVDPCTADTCVNNTCDFSLIVGCCHTDADCADTDACTADLCAPSGMCTNDPITCNDQNACTTDTCDPVTGCMYNLETCDDGDACTQDSCDPGTGCIHVVLTCDDSDQCTLDACDPTSGCFYSAVTCDDGDVCTLDSCDPFSGCVYNAVICDDSDWCTQDACAPGIGCVYDAVTCDDNDLCTQDSCDTATGCVYNPITCDDGDGCTTDSCDPMLGCVSTPPFCDDGNMCTSDACMNGQCVYTPIIPVPPGCETGGYGCSPGFWKQPQHLQYWVGYMPGDLYEVVFGVDASFPSMTLLQVLQEGGGGERALGRHAVSALLNSTSGEVDYGLTTAQVIAMVQNAYATGNFVGAVAMFEKQNKLGCTIGRSKNSGRERGR